MVRNALHVKEMEINLIPPFLMREAGIQLNECPKLHACPPVTVDYHSINFKDEGLRIPLQLIGTFSYFNHRVPELNEISNLTVLFLTPDSSSWDPSSSDFASQEAAFTDPTSGGLIDKPAKTEHMLVTNEDTVNNLDVYSTQAQPLVMPCISAVESTIDSCISSATAQHLTMLNQLALHLKTRASHSMTTCLP